MMPLTPKSNKLLLYVLLSIVFIYSLLITHFFMPAQEFTYG